MKANPCKNCQSPFHTAFKCPFKKGSYLKPESKHAHHKRMKTRAEWFRDNPGPWVCYLQISALCPKKLTKELLTLEHVEPRSKAPELKYVVGNIRPSCGWCNKLKGSRTLDKLILLFPGLEERL